MTTDPRQAKQLPDTVDQGLECRREDLLLPYQKRLIQAMAEHPVVVVEKSRRIGYTWAAAAGSVLEAAAERGAGGMDQLYIGYNLDMAREFIDTCASWARLFDRAASEVRETVFPDGPDADIKAFRIDFGSGFEIIALSSKPRSLRGRQGRVIVDEAAFHDALEALLKAALALLIWGGRVTVISTHEGAANPFNRLIEDCRCGRKPYPVLRVTFDDALADGLYRRICLVTGKDWSAEAEAAWRAEIVAFYGSDADEELHCIPANAAGQWLPRPLIEARMVPGIPVLRWARPAQFVDLPDADRAAEALDWCDTHLAPLLRDVPSARVSFGQDFGRVGDLSVIWLLLLQPDLVRRTLCVVELRNIPFEEQRIILFYILDRLPGFARGAMDAGGNGAFLAERAGQTYGFSRIEEVRFTVDWYRQHMPPFKAAMEGAGLLLPKDADILTDLEAVKTDGGVAQVPRSVRSVGTDGGQRHGDAAIAAVLAHYATLGEVRRYGYTPARPETRPEGRFGFDDDEPAERLRFGRGGF